MPMHPLVLEAFEIPVKRRVFSMSLGIATVDMHPQLALNSVFKFRLDSAFFYVKKHANLFQSNGLERGQLA